MTNQRSRAGFLGRTEISAQPSRDHATAVGFSAETQIDANAALGFPVTASYSVGLSASVLADDIAAAFHVGINPTQEGSFIVPLEFDKGMPPVAGSVSYNDVYPMVADALDKLLYIAPQITSLSNNYGTVEIGRSITNVMISWSVNKTMTSASLTDAGAVLSQTSYTAAGPFTADKTWTLTVGDGKNTVSASTTLSFRRKRYWGVSASTTLDDAAILALGGSEFATSFGKSVTYNCSGGRYPYIAYPSSFGTPSAVTVGGLAFTDFTVTTQSFTNASGHTENYNVVRFNNIQTGASIAVVWQ